MPILNALQLHPELWNQNTLRTTHQGTPHTQVDDIWIRFNDLAEYERTKDPASIIDGHESIWYPAAAKLPAIRNFCFWLMGRVEGERLGRVLVTRLRPGRVIKAHTDSGDHAAYYERYHLVLQSLPGSIFHCGEETIQMRQGDVWWFDNAVTHAVENNSADDRLHLIVDIKVGK